MPVITRSEFHAPQGRGGRDGEQIKKKKIKEEKKLKKKKKKKDRLLWSLLKSDLKFGAN